MIENLHLNAVKYGERGTPIDGCITARKDGTELIVANQGLPIHRDDRESDFALAFSHSGHQFDWGY